MPSSHPAPVPQTNWQLLPRHPAWQRYGQEMMSFVPYFVMGIVLSLIPFGLNFYDWQRKGKIWQGLVHSLTFGVTISCTIWLTFAVVYGIATWVSIRRHQSLLLKPSMRLIGSGLVGGVGLMVGIWLALKIQSWRLNQPFTLSSYFYSMLQGLFFGLIFFFHLAYRFAKEDALKLEARVAETRYQVLEHQMQPHFLFNALNSLAELIESNHDSAADMVYKLSDLYRVIVTHSQTRTASLRSELLIVRSYLELEQLRLGPRLTFEIESPDDDQSIFIPGLVLQMLVENAIKHGVAASLDGGTIDVRVTRQTDGWYLAEVINTGSSTGQPGAGTQIGLTNIRERLTLLYGQQHNFQLTSGAQGDITASFRFTGAHLD
ncbi:MAG TPA: histidine kinase [Acidobacteriota bacterium]|nr:histidine kinase [Acidobacteriota bacterium]